MKTTEIIKDLERERKTLTDQVDAINMTLDGLRMYKDLRVGPSPEPTKQASNGGSNVTRIMMKCKDCGLESDWPTSRAKHVKERHGYKGDKGSTTSRYWETV